MIKIFKSIKPLQFIIALITISAAVGCDLYLPTLTSEIIDKGVIAQDTDFVIRTGILMVGVSIVGLCFGAINIFVGSRESQRVGEVLRGKLFHKVEHMSLDEFDQFGTATLITRATNDVNQVVQMLMMTLRMVLRSPITLIIAFILAFSKSPELSVVFVVVLPLLAVVTGIVMKLAMPLFKVQQEKIDKLNLVFREGLTGVRVIRAFGKVGTEKERYDDANQEYTGVAMRVQMIFAVMMPIVTLAFSGTSIAIVWFGGHLVNTHSMDIGNMIAFMTYAMQILMSFIFVTMILAMFPRAEASAKRINEVLAVDHVIKDDPSAVHFERLGTDATIEFKNVGYAYKGAEKDAICDISFSAKAGETVAIIGGTGSGKTTLVNLIPRFYDVTEGQIVVNGVEVKEGYQRSLRDILSLVPQKAVLFIGTIRENLLYAKADATDEQIWKALEIAQAKDFVEGLEDGLDHQVEQGGGNFSGGQRQRLAIARAILRDADFYIYDDSFSALDFRTDSKLRAALKREMTRGVNIIVAQRVSTVMDADNILVLDDGVLVAQGKHDDLYKNCEVYQEIVNSQLREEDLSNV
ncbi:MAG: ABC transporter ATP-binding protein/permease [Lactobacillales bacterium]|jgi:ATP-binding cassette subfamily B protein|nr:ABC transporter ATP-binding protein/permease [Lactobacillales bacterium]